MSRVVYVNGSYVAENEGKVSIFDRGFLFADGIYEVTAVINGKLVTSSFSFGRLVTKVDLTIDKRKGDVVSMTADNRIVTRDVALDPDITALINKYRTLSAPFANRVVGEISATITRVANPAGESALKGVYAN